MKSADTEGVSGCRLFGCLLLFDVVRCCSMLFDVLRCSSMSWRMIATGAPPHEAAKSDGDPSALPHNDQPKPRARLH